MKVEKFAVSIHYGAGHHFLKKTDFEKEKDAIMYARQEIKVALMLRERNKNRGAKPVVHVWTLLTSYDGTLPLAPRDPPADPD